MTFIRNGEEYGSKDAANHMRRKLDYAGKRIKTARQFIDYLATKSSTSGKLYKIRFKDGTEVKSGEWLTAELKRIESAPAAEQATASISRPVDPRVVGKREAAKRMQVSEASLEVGTVTEDATGWRVTIWRLPKTPGGFCDVTVAKDGTVSQYRPGK